MTLNKELKALLLSENEEDCRLAFEICKRKKIRVKEINQFEKDHINNGTYNKLPIYQIICEYLDWTDRYEKWYKWQKWATIQ